MNKFILLLGSMCMYAARVKKCVLIIFTVEQFEEYDGGFIDLSWYNILHTMMTHVQTVQTLEARGRYRL